jgi:hypothetical protein
MFLFMSKQDALCAASGCPELREDVSAEFCAKHAREIEEFERWLAGRPKWLGRPSPRSAPSAGP